MIDDLLSRLDRVKSTGHGRWIASCPAHEDRHPSMTIRDLDDGRVLCHCFAGCSIEDIVGALGLELDALFPAQETHHLQKPLRTRVHPADALRAIALEASIVMIVAADVRRGVATSNDVDRLQLSIERIQSALEESHVE